MKRSLSAVDADPVGTVEIAARLGVPRHIIDMARQRPWKDFPDQRWTVGGRPAWDWNADDLPGWAEQNL